MFPELFIRFFPSWLKEKFSFLKKTVSGNCDHKTPIHGSWLFKMSSFDNNQRYTWWFITNAIHFIGIYHVYNVETSPVDYHKGLLHKQWCFYLTDCYVAIKNPILCRILNDLRNVRHIFKARKSYSKVECVVQSYFTSSWFRLSDEASSALGSKIGSNSQSQDALVQVPRCLVPFYSSTCHGLLYTPSSMWNSTSLICLKNRICRHKVKGAAVSPTFGA